MALPKGRLGWSTGLASRRASVRRRDGPAPHLLSLSINNLAVRTMRLNPRDVILAAGFAAILGDRRHAIDVGRRWTVIVRCRLRDLMRRVGCGYIRGPNRN